MKNCDENGQVDFEVGGSFVNSYLLLTHITQIYNKNTIKSSLFNVNLSYAIFY